jgi:hypothetical protein
MLTIFSIPKPFKGHIETIQRNAIQSWTLLHPRPEILLFGNEAGTAQVAAEFGLRHEPEIATNQYGTPLLNDLFQKAEGRSSNPILAYVNADILLVSGFQEAASHLWNWRSSFLMIGARWDVDIREALNFQAPSWREALRQLALQMDQRRPPWWIDYFVFAKGLGTNVLPFALGRSVWDNWLIWHARSMGASIVDASEAVMAVHQNHDYGHHPQGYKGVWEGEEAAANRVLAGGEDHHLSIEDATHFLTPSLRIRRKLLSKEAKYFLFVNFVEKTLAARKRLGLQRSGWLGTFLGRPSNSRKA